jgi:hypothetical protein
VYDFSVYTGIKLNLHLSRQLELARVKLVVIKKRRLLLEAHAQNLPHVGGAVAIRRDRVHLENPVLLRCRRDVAIQVKFASKLRKQEII